MIGRVFLGRYEAVRLLGEGGMGRVYLARQIDLGRQVVVKVMHDHIAADPRFRDRFERECHLMAGFQHPYAVTLYDASLTDPHGPCLIMEYVKGINLDQLLAKNRRLSPARVGRLVAQLCDVLQAAHEQGMIHRDLKPGNLMVIEADTPRERLKVMDFGLAKLVDSTVLKKVTDTNVDFAVGTPGYICPEQVRGEEMDHRGDLYGVGIILYELLTGRLPFQRESSMDMLLAHATEPPPTFAQLELGDVIPAEIEAVVMACLEKDPSKRPQTARELAERYDRALETARAATGGAGVDSGSYPRPHVPVPTQPGIDVGPIPSDPSTYECTMEAWMDQAVGRVKIRGFVHDFGAEVLESVPGLIRLRLGSQRVKGRKTPTALSWLGIGRRLGPIDVELWMHQIDPARENRLFIVVRFRPTHSTQLLDQDWRDRCDQIFIDLRAYLVGT
jgi:serine/threonine-protein kinase